MKSRDPLEADWWANATPRERVAFFLGTHRGRGYGWPGRSAMHQIEYRFGLRDDPPPAKAGPRLRIVHDPTAPCRTEGCDEPVGEYVSGRPPKNCPAHRDARGAARRRLAATERAEGAGTS